MSGEMYLCETGELIQTSIKQFYNQLVRTAGFMLLYLSKLLNIYPSLQSEHLAPIKPPAEQCRATFTVWLLWTSPPIQRYHVVLIIFTISNTVWFDFTVSRAGSEQMVYKLPSTEGDLQRACF